MDTYYSHADTLKFVLHTGNAIFDSKKLRHKTMFLVLCAIIIVLWLDIQVERSNRRVKLKIRKSCNRSICLFRQNDFNLYLLCDLIRLFSIKNTFGSRNLFAVHVTPLCLWVGLPNVIYERMAC